jgi:hypothetical protein
MPRHVGWIAATLLAVLVGCCVSADAEEAAGEAAFGRAFNAPELDWRLCPAPFPAGCEISILHGDFLQPNSDVFLRFPAKYELPPHWHTSAERMVLVAGELHVTYDGQAATVLKPGTYAYGPPKAVHRGRCVSDQPCVLFVAFVAPVDLIAAD